MSATQHVTRALARSWGLLLVGVVVAAALAAVLLQPREWTAASRVGVLYRDVTPVVVSEAGVPSAGAGDAAARDVVLATSDEFARELTGALGLEGGSHELWETLTVAQEPGAALAFTATSPDRETAVRIADTAADVFVDHFAAAVLPGREELEAARERLGATAEPLEATVERLDRLAALTPPARVIAGAGDAQRAGLPPARGAAAAAAGGLVVTLLLVAAREGLDPRVWYAEEIGQRLDLPVVAPRDKRWRQRRRAGADVLQRAVDALGDSRPPERGIVVALTPLGAPRRGDRPACALVAFLEGLRCRVGLVDLDGDGAEPRRRALGKHGSWTIDGKSADDLKALAGERFTEGTRPLVLERLAEELDWVVMTTPSPLHSPRARRVASASDAVAVTVAPGRVTREQLEAARQELAGWGSRPQFVLVTRRS